MGSSEGPQESGQVIDNLSGHSLKAIWIKSLNVL